MRKGKEVNNKLNIKDKLIGNTKNTRDLIPPNSPYIKNIRETFPIKQGNIPDNELLEIKQLLIFLKPYQVIPEWPNEEELLVKIF